jgi:ABC-type Zn2+ transport system substrate-binding protein/surface adhesin
VRIVIQLGHLSTSADAQAAVDFIFQELDEMLASLHVVVTLSSRAFWMMSTLNRLTSGFAADAGDENDDDDDDDDDDNNVDDDNDDDEDDDDVIDDDHKLASTCCANIAETNI